MRKPAQTRFDVVVIGGGVAAGSCVTTLREAGYAGTIALVCAEPHPPYTRPGLTKQVLRGEKPADAALWRSAGWYGEQSVELFTGTEAQAIDSAVHGVELSGRALTYGSLVLATGAEPRHLDFGPAIADRVHVLRSFADADSIRPQLGEGTRWLVIGGGFIGAEFAASAALTGSDVSLVMRQDVILEQAFGAVVGAWFDSRLRRRGVNVHAGSDVSSVERSADGLRITLGDWAFLEYVGLGGGSAVMRGSTDGEDMSAAYLDDDGVLTGLIAVGRPDDLSAARELVVERARLAADVITDGRLPLADCRLGPLVTT